MKKQMIGMAVAVLVAVFSIVALAGDWQIPRFGSTSAGTLTWTNDLGVCQLGHVIMTPKTTTLCTNTCLLISNSGAVTNVLIAQVSLNGTNTTITELNLCMDDTAILRFSTGPTNLQSYYPITIRDVKGKR